MFFEMPLVATGRMKWKEHEERWSGAMVVVDGRAGGGGSGVLLERW